MLLKPEYTNRNGSITCCLSLHWRHNDNDGASNHQPHGCLLKRLSRRISKKTSKLRVTGLCEGNSPVTDEFPAQRASYAENVSIWWRHHGPGSLHRQVISSRHTEGGFTFPSPFICLRVRSKIKSKRILCFLSTYLIHEVKDNRRVLIVIILHRKWMLVKEHPVIMHWHLNVMNMQIYLFSIHSIPHISLAMIK